MGRPWTPNLITLIELEEVHVECIATCCDCCAGGLGLGNFPSGSRAWPVDAF